MARLIQLRGAEQLSAAHVRLAALYRGNVSAVHRARQAVVDGDGTTAGAPVPDFLREGWAGAAPVALRTMQVVFNREPPQPLDLLQIPVSRRIALVCGSCPELRGCQVG
ncbi:hypothetical protein [Streptomyces sp. NPDC017988]|uniref:hypothetical protein n=1 Tax=Streptomyces sp. NPDC017988 TaxID=3365025 RepID=UPI0037A05EF1